MGRVRRFQENVSESCCACAGDLSTAAFLAILLLLIFAIVGLICLLVAWAMVSNGKVMFFFPYCFTSSKILEKTWDVEVFA